MLLTPPLLSAQDRFTIEVTAHGGVPLNDSLQSNICCGGASVFSRQEIDQAKYVVGVSSGVVLHDRLRVEFGAFYMPVSFRNILTFPTTSPPTVTPVHGAAWEFPLLADYRWMRGNLRPFSGGGVVLHDTLSGRFESNPDQSPSPVFRGGVEWIRGRMAIRPELRWILYKQTASSTNQEIGRPENQLEFLVGFTFRMPHR
jgi:hypothetical protein